MIEIRGFYIRNAYVLVLVFVAFHMEYLGLGTAKLNWFDAFTEFYWIGGWFDFLLDYFL